MKDRIMKFLKIDKLYFICKTHEDDVVEIKKDINKLKKNIAEMKSLKKDISKDIHDFEKATTETISRIIDEFNDIKAPRAWTSWGRNEYIEQMQKLLDTHKKWLEVNGLLKAPKK